MRNDVIENWRNNELKTLIFVYYAGHGVMTDMTQVLSNGGFKKGKQSRHHARYPLEKQLRSLGKE